MTNQSAPASSIGVAALVAGLSEATVRYYERVGLLDPIPRDPSTGHRLFSESAGQRLEVLACLREVGLGIADMRSYVDALTADPPRADELSRLFEEHVRRTTLEIERIRRRHAYAEAKRELWAARAANDPERTEAARARAVVVVQRLRDQMSETAES